MNDYIIIRYGENELEITREQFYDFCDYYKAEIFDTYREDIEDNFGQELKEHFRQEANEVFELERETKQEIVNKQFRED